MAHLRKHYAEEVRPALKASLGLDNIMQVPKLRKIVLNIGVGEAIANKKALEGALSDLAIVSGQKPVATLARKSVASFKVREGFPIGAKVTLRGNHMYDFLYRLINIALPRVRDFRGLSTKSFDRNGNYNLGIKEQIIFPEIDYDKVDALRGMDIAIVTSTDDAALSLALLRSLNFPFYD